MAKNMMESVSDEELLSAFIPGDTAHTLIKEYSSLYNVLHIVSERQLKTMKGIGNANLNRMCCLREILDRVNREKTTVPKFLGTSTAATSYFRFLKDRMQEELWVVFLNAKNQAIGKKMVSLGTLNASLAEPREIYHAAVQFMAANIIIAHNHPSGDATPSNEDFAVTKAAIKAGRLLHIHLLDHIIIGKYKDTSIRETRPDLWD